MTLLNDLTLFIAIVFFAASALSFLVLAIISYKNDPTYLLNQLFASAFLLLFFFSSLMGIAFLIFPFNEVPLENMVVTIIAIIFLEIAFSLMALAGRTISTSALSVINKDSVKYLIPLVVGLLLLPLLLVDDSLLVFIGFISIFVVTFLYGTLFSNALETAAENSDDAFFKRKTSLWTKSFNLFGVLSAIAWFLITFLPMNDLLGDFSQVTIILPAGATMIGATLMYRSFMMKNPDTSPNES